MQVHVKGKVSLCTIKNVKNAPTLRCQLLPALATAMLRIRVSFDDESAYIVRNARGDILATGSIANNLFAFDVDSTCRNKDTTLCEKPDLWNQRRVHMSPYRIRNMVNNAVE